MTFSLIRGLWWWGVTTTSDFIEASSLGRLPSKAKDPNLALRHDYPPLDANPMFQYHRDIAIIVVFIIIIIVVVVNIIIIIIIIIIITILSLLLSLFKAGTPYRY